MLFSDSCGSNPCKNGGTCINETNGFRCRCTDKYEGDLCDVSKFDLAILYLYISVLMWLHEMKLISTVPQYKLAQLQYSSDTHKGFSEPNKSGRIPISPQSDRGDIEPKNAAKTCVKLLSWSSIHFHLTLKFLVFLTFFLFRFTFLVQLNVCAMLPTPSMKMRSCAPWNYTKLLTHLSLQRWPLLSGSSYGRLFTAESWRTALKVFYLGTTSTPPRLCLHANPVLLTSSIVIRK